MIAQSNRIFQRHICRIPIEYRTDEAEEYREAVVYNCSKTGMYFELKSIIMPGESIHIIVSTSLHSAEEPERFRYYLAQAAWCRSIADASKPRYGCGVRLLRRSCESEILNLEIICYSCDMCGLLIPCQNLRKTEEFLVICPACDWHFVAMPDGNLKKSFKQYVAGNVL
jgi:hypothetical protein